MNAYCWRSGLIGFCEGVIPDGTMPIRFKATQEEIETIKACARLAYDNKTLLVPGIPEADDSFAAYEAFTRFIDFLGFKPHEKKDRSRKRRSA